MMYVEIGHPTQPAQDRLGPEPGAQRELQEADRKIGQAIAYMMQHLNKQLQVAKLAALVNISPSHFFALFKRRTGCAPIDFFIRLRMQHACQLLDGTSLNVKEVAAVLGYDDPFYFSRTFKAVNHVAPSEYRMMPGERKDAVRNAALPSRLLRKAQSNAALAPGFSEPVPEPPSDATGGQFATSSGSESRKNKDLNGRIVHVTHTHTGSSKDDFYRRG
jgi:AraC-like DNA-binding protein